MASHKSTGFFFDVLKWRGSRSAQRMSFSERGVYFEMLCEQWERRNLPDDPKAVARLIAVTDLQIAEVIAAWQSVREQFVTSRGSSQVIYNASLERTRRAQLAYRRGKQEAGSSGGKATAAKRTENKELRSSSAAALLQQKPALCSDLNRSDLNRSDKTVQEHKSSGAAAPRPAAENLQVITAVVHDVIEAIGTGSSDLSEAVKSRCATLKISYDSATVQKAIESARFQRGKKAG